MAVLKSISSLVILSLFLTFLPASNVQDQEYMIKNFVLVEGGAFIMGDDLVENRPAHKVIVSSFYINASEVTYKEWKEFADDYLTDFDWERATFLNYYEGVTGGYVNWQDDMPMFNLSWFEAIKYCNWLSQKHGLEPAYSYEEDPATVVWNRTANGYRLPTEAEWEYAAIGGQKSQGYKYAGSDDIDEVAWNKKNSERRPHPIKNKKPNELGVYDMTGNVAEWCWDFLSITYYDDSPEIDPIGPNIGYGPGFFTSKIEEHQAKVVRGGEWTTPVQWLSVRHRMASSFHYHGNIGLRLARNTE